MQYLVLAYSAKHAELTNNVGNLALLTVAAELDLIPKHLALHANDAYRLFRARQHALRLRGDKYARLPISEVAEKVDSVRQLWSWVFDEQKA